MTYISSASSGQWSDELTWTGSAVPVAGDTVWIKAGHDVIIDTDGITIGNYTVTTGATDLYIAPGATLRFDIGLYDVDTFTCRGNIQAAGAFIADYSNTSHTLTIGIDQGSQASGVFGIYQYPGSTTSGLLQLIGNTAWRCPADTYYTSLADAVSPSGTTLGFVDDILLDAVGSSQVQLCVVGDTHTTSEIVTVSSYVAATKVVTLTSGVVNAHDAGRKVFNMSRNITVTDVSSDTSKRTWINVQRCRGSGVSNCRIESVRFERFGSAINQSKQGLCLSNASTVNGSMECTVKRCAFYLAQKGYGIYYNLYPSGAGAHEVVIADNVFWNGLGFEINETGSWHCVTPITNPWIVRNGYASGTMAIQLSTMGGSIRVKGGGAYGYASNGLLIGLSGTGIGGAHHQPWIEDFDFDNAKSVSNLAMAFSASTSASPPANSAYTTWQARIVRPIAPGGNLNTQGLPMMVFPGPINPTFVAIHDQNNDNDQSYTFYTYGAVYKETSVTKDASGKAVRVEPNSYSTAYNLIYPEFFVPVKSTNTVTISVWLRKNQDQASNRPKIMLYLPGNEWGDTADSTATMTDVTDTWEQVTVTGNPSRAGTARVVLATTYGTSGYKVYLDEFTVSQP